MSAADAVREVARAALADRGLDVVDVTVTPAGRRRVVRILVDRSVSGLDPSDHTSRVPPMDLDEVTEATHTVSAALDSAEPLGNAPYVLEVSSRASTARCGPGPSCAGTSAGSSQSRHPGRNSSPDGSLLSGRTR